MEAVIVYKRLLLVSFKLLGQIIRIRFEYMKLQTNDQLNRANYL